MRKVLHLSGAYFVSVFPRALISGGLLFFVSQGVSAQLTADFVATPTEVCIGVPVMFSNATQNITGEITYNWDFGNGATPATGTGPGPHYVTYSIADTVTVSLSVTDETGTDSEIKTDYIIVGDAAPVFTLCPGPPLKYSCDPGQCYATVDYSSFIAVSGSPEPVLTYTFSGATNGSGSGTGSGSELTYGSTTVDITATSSCSPPASCNFIIVVNTPPVADAGGPYDICQGSSVTLDGTSSYDPDPDCGDSVWSYRWDINNDGSTDIFLAKPTLTWASLVGYGLGVGEHTIRLEVDDAQGGINSDYTTLTINPLPTVSIQGTASICIGGTTTLSPSSGGTWVSNNESVATVTSDGVVTGISGGQVTFTFTETSTGCSSSTSTILVNSLPTVTLGALPSVCVDAVAINLTQGSPTEGTYSGPGIINGTTGLFDPSVAGTGTHTITYTYTDGTTGCAASSTNTITVNGIPTITVSTSPACSADLLTYSFEVTVSSGTVTTSAGTVADLGGNDWRITGVAVGNGVTVTVTDANSCDNAVSVASPDCSCPILAAPVSGGNQSYCAGESIPSLTVNVGDGETADWYNQASGGTLLLSGNTTYTPAAPGTYYAEARVTANDCVSSTRTAVILTENSLPTVTLGALPSVCVDAVAINLTQGSPTEGTYSGPGIINGTTGLFDPSVAGTGTHTITYTYTDGTTGCTASATGTITVNICTKTLNLTLYLEGLYNGVNGLVKVQDCDDGETSFDLFAGNISDTLTVELAQAVFPYNTLFSQHGVPLNTDGTISLTNIPGDLAENCHVVIKHRNHLETWSQSISLTGSLVNYNFTDAINKAWGDNMVLVGSNYCLYTGDTNNDEYVDVFDLIITFNLNKLSGFGYQVSDINADGFVDVFDLVKVFNNNRKGVGMNTPLAPMK